MTGKAVIPAGEATAKVRLCAAAAREAGALLVARTDALAVEGVPAAIARAKAFAAAGADLIFVEAGPDEAAVRNVAKALGGGKPLVANAVDLGAGLAADTLFALGFSVALFPTSALRAQAAATETLFAHLADHGGVGRAGWLSSWEDVNDLAGLPAMLRAGQAEDL
jgi:2-methylisocitrate lyase-like PEP mutase family enzyme